MDWLQPIDNYCERLTPEMWAEPVNALSNVAILIVGLIGRIWTHRLPDGISRGWPYALASLVMAVAVGSFLFHTFAQFWSMLADQIPILVFSVVFFGFTLKKVFKLSTLVTVIILVFYVVFGVWLRGLGDEVLNGSLTYANALLGLVASGVVLWQTSHPLAGYYLSASGVFITALVLRTVDAAVCDQMAIGTHFLWHLLIAVLLWLLLRACIEHQRRSE